MTLRAWWTSPIVAAGLISGYAVAATTGIRPLGGVVLLLAGGLAAWIWHDRDGWPVAVGLGVVYAAAFAASHPLASAIGTWPSVLGVSAVAALSAYLASDRRIGSNASKNPIRKDGAAPSNETPRPPRNLGHRRSSADDTPAGHGSAEHMHEEAGHERACRGTAHGPSLLRRRGRELQVPG